MARVTCRCGEMLSVTSSDPDRLICPRCGAKIRVRRSQTQRPDGAPSSDGYLRFNCSCGRRLKVRSDERPEAGKCPDCGRIVPVPDSAWEETAGGPPRVQGQGSTSSSSRTEDMDAVDLDRLQQWASRFPAATQKPQPGDLTTTSHPSLGAVASAATEPPGMKMEAGLRVCPRCAKPLHMSATVCRSCGEPVPRR